MTVQYRPPRKMPEGYKSAQEFIAKIEAAEGLKSTGWHYDEKPSAEEVAYKSQVHHGGAELMVRKVLGSLDLRRPTWTLFVAPSTPESGR